MDRMEGETFFEGPEKRLELFYDNQQSWLETSREQWESLLSKAKCSILSELKFESGRAFLLSESSLFVWRDRVMLKTCGQTEILQCLSGLMSRGNPRLILYSHRNFIRPSEQRLPYQTPDQEWIEWRSQVPRGTTERLDRAPYTFFVWRSSLQNLPAPFYEYSTTRVPNSIQHAFESKTSSMTAWKKFENTLVDEHWFQPQGYSANVSGDGWYLTLHLTPQKSCSYLSVESNMDPTRFKRWIENLVESHDSSAVYCRVG